MDQQVELLLTKQKVIYYKAEVAKYKNRILELERLVEKEAIRNKFLQKKIQELNVEKIAVYLNEINELKQRVMEMEVELEEERTFLKEPLPINDSAESEKSDFYCFFNYSILFPREEDSTVSIFGDFIIINIGNKPMEDFQVCLKVKPVGAINLSGKINNPKLSMEIEGRDTHWVYAIDNWIHKIRKEGEYWIKPLKINDQTSFSLKNFEVTLSPLKNTKYEVEASIYLLNQNTFHKAQNKILVYI